VALEGLRDILQTDERVRAIYARTGVETTDSGLPCAPSEANFPVSRYKNMLLEQIESTEVFRAGENNSEIFVAAWASGFGGGTRHVDNCWLNHLPVIQVASLDFYKTQNPGSPSSGTSMETGIFGRTDRRVPTPVVRG